MKDFLVQLINDDKFDIGLNEEDINILINQLDSIKKQYLYKGNFHGLFHSEKVLLFGYLIGKHNKLNPTEMQIIMDACVYHDIGRINNAEENFHGLASANKIGEEHDLILTNDIYQDVDNIDYVRAICDAHSRSDSLDKNTFANYAYENPSLDFNTFKRLSDILKDADAVDRTRFPYVWDASLKEDFLRYDYSKKIIGFAHYINQLYRNREIKRLYDKYSPKFERRSDDINKYGCFHGIGADFFKLESIVNNGILSTYSRKIQDLDVNGNFFGSNGELWVSVVDGNMISQNGDAFKKYINSGISFYCLVSRIRDVSIESKEEQEENDDYIDIRNKREYSDEKYVFDKIDKDQLHSIIVPNHILNANIDNLNYMTCGINIISIMETVDYYKKEMMKRGFYDKTYDAPIQQLIALCKQEKHEFDKVPYHQQSNERYHQFACKTEDLKNKINQEIQKMMKAFYCFKLHRPNIEETVIKVKDVINYLTPILGFDKIINSSTDETIIILNELSYEKNNNKKI